MSYTHGMHQENNPEFRRLAKEDFDKADRGQPIPEDNAARAGGQVCGLCGLVIDANADVRRRSDGEWVHETCPPDPDR